MKGVAEARLRTVLAGAIVVLVAGPVGAAVVLGVAYGESPCILCWAQRTSMALMALTGIFVLRYGPRPRYLGTLVLLGLWGLYMALRHWSLHISRDVGQGFAAAYFGAHTYVWAGVVHAVVLAALGALLLVLREDSVQTGARPLGPLARFATVTFLIVIAANALQAFVTTGPPPFMGQADPLRFSWNPSRWVWLADDELGGAITLRGSWNVPAPDPAFVEASTDPTAGPLAGIPSLAVLRWDSIRAPAGGRWTDLAYDPAADRFLATTEGHGVVVLDATLASALHAVRLDPHFSVELTPLAGAAFVGDTLLAMATNKSYAMLRLEADADEAYEWRHFLETTGGVAEVRRSRLSTLRARQMYVSSAAYDPDADELVTISVPSEHHRRMVVSRFARADLELSSEFPVEIGPTLALAGPDRSPAEYVVTGATVVDGTLYAVSAAYSTILAIDLSTRRLVSAFAVPGLEQPVGLALRADDWLVAQADGRVAVVPRAPLTDS